MFTVGYYRFTTALFIRGVLSYSTLFLPSCLTHSLIYMFEHITPICQHDLCNIAYTMFSFSSNRIMQSWSVYYQAHLSGSPLLHKFHTWCYRSMPMSMSVYLSSNMIMPSSSVYYQGLLSDSGHFVRLWTFCPTLDILYDSGNFCWKIYKKYQI